MNRICRQHKKQVLNDMTTARTGESDPLQDQQ